jgi:hypothetical protein
MKTVLFLLAALSINIYSQCSDAGICSIGGYSPEFSNKIGLAYSFGKSGKEDDITYNAIILEGDFRLFEKTSLFLSLPFSSQSGPLGSASGPGDLLILINRFIIEDDFNLNILGGVQTSIGDENKNQLPQKYQSTLGTTDFLFGTSLSYGNLFASAGFQLAGDRNENILRLKRGNDVMLRLGGNYSFSDMFSGSLELISVKRLSESSIADSLNPNNFVNVPGSDNLQINIAASINYLPVEYLELQLFGAMPLKNRPVNVDGLTRAVTISAGLRYLF